MPAAAVIPAPVAYIKVVAVKKLVVRTRVRGRSRGPGAAAPSSIVDFGRPFAFPALSAGVNRYIDGRGSAGVRRVVAPLGKVSAWCARRVACFPTLWSSRPGSRAPFRYAPSSPSVISPPRVLLTECPRRPVRSL